MKRYVLKVPTM